MSPASETHHHRSTTKASHKPFKSRFTSKSALKDLAKGKIESAQLGHRKTRHQQVMSKFDRKNRAKQRRLNSHRDNAQVTKIFSGQDRAPRNVALVPLCETVDLQQAVKLLNDSLDVKDTSQVEGGLRVEIPRFKQDLCYIVTQRELLAVLDACRSADYVMFILSSSEEVDALGENIIKCVESQGITTCYAAALGLDAIEPLKKRTAILGSLRSFMSHFIPHVEKIFSLDSQQECQNLLRSLCTTVPKGIRWREDRSWMLVEDIQINTSSSSETTDYQRDDGAMAEVVLTGHVRGRHMKADRLIQIGDLGDYQIAKIEAAPKYKSHPKKSNSADIELTDAIQDLPSHDQDTLEKLAPVDLLMDDSRPRTLPVDSYQRATVLVDDDEPLLIDETADEDELHLPKKLPKGTSEYQSAWFLGQDDISEDEGSDLEDTEDVLAANVHTNATESLNGTAADNENDVDMAETENTDAAQSELLDYDLSAADDEALSAYREQKRRLLEAEEDLEFPDEIELHPNAIARERLARYRGLKSFRTSPWSSEADKHHQPEDWPRLLTISNYKAAKAKVTSESLVGGVAPGTRVHIHVHNVPQSLLHNRSSSKPLTIFSLLRHEHKHTAVNFTINLSSDEKQPIKSKEELIVQCGHRRFVANPLFSQPGNTPNDVHKFERWLHPGSTAIASFTAPLTWGAVPVLYFKRSAAPAADEMDTDAPPKQRLRFVGTGTATTPSTSRVIAKRIVLTGQAYRVHKRQVTVRYMFFSRADYEYFAALPLWTNRGRQGVMKEPLGLHGHYKAAFDGRVGMQDAIAVSLYKRVWPRPARLLRPEEV